MTKPLLKGLAVLLLGVSIGAVNKTQFTLNASAYGLNAPRYADFFNHEETYRTNYKVQDYMGKHFLLKREYAKALPYFERCVIPCVGMRRKEPRPNTIWTIAGPSSTRGN